jgi:hypothetical protein
MYTGQLERPKQNKIHIKSGLRIRLVNRIREEKIMKKMIKLKKRLTHFPNQRMKDSQRTFMSFFTKRKILKERKTLLTAKYTSSN